MCSIDIEGLEIGIQEMSRFFSFNVSHSMKKSKMREGKKVEKYSPFGYLWVSSLNSQAGDRQQHLKNMKNTNILYSFGVEAKEFFLAAHILLYNSPAWPFRHQLRSRLRQKSPARGGQHGCCSYICQRFFISLRL